MDEINTTREDVINAVNEASRKLIAWLASDPEAGSGYAAYDAGMHLATAIDRLALKR